MSVTPCHDEIDLGGQQARDKISIALQTPLGASILDDKVLALLIPEGAQCWSNETAGDYHMSGTEQAKPPYLPGRLLRHQRVARPGGRQPS